MAETSDIAGIDQALQTIWDKAPLISTSISYQGGKPVSFAPIVNPPAAETMIERMAREMFRLRRRDQGASYFGGQDEIDADWRICKPLYLADARAVLAVMREPLIAALKPFADCAEELDGSQDTPRAPDGEWAKFRLLTDDYRRARDTVAMIDAALAE